MAAWIRGKLLGAGSFGSVNLAVKRESGEVFAVKSVPASTPGALQAIENEIQIFQSLNSEYIVGCYGSDWTEESGVTLRNAFLEYMPGGNLTDFVKQFASFDEQLLRTYTRSIVEGIEYLHSQGIVHCDIKGKNVLVGNGGAVKLTDFGSSKRVGEERAMAGTPLWMAPEVIWQEEQGPASDIWSLGCTVVEMATGRAPWSQITNQFAALYHIACTEEIPDLPASLSAEAKDFLSHCFQREPAKRWTSAQLLKHPFLTNRFSTPLTIAVDSNVEFSDSLDSSDSSTPSLLKRGLISPVLQVEDNSGWSMPDSPWIVVRSPKSVSPTPDTDTLSLAPSTCLEVSISHDDVADGEEGTGEIGGFGISEAESNYLGIYKCYHVEDDSIARKLDFSCAKWKHESARSCLIPLDWLLCSGGLRCLRSSCILLYKKKLQLHQNSPSRLCVSIYVQLVALFNHLCLIETFLSLMFAPFLCGAFSDIFKMQSLCWKSCFS